MAVNIDQVYKTVLLIINKEQRGYLTPNEFNRLATQVQLEIIDGYFETINQQMRVPQNSTEYGDRVKNVQEQLDVFKTIGNCAFTAATTTKAAFFTPPTSSGAASGTQLLSSTTNQITYPLTTITQSQVEDSTVVVTYLGAAFANFNITGGVFNLTGGSLPTGVANNIVITLYPQDFYKLGTVLYRDDRMVEAIQRNELAMLNMSPISKPTDNFPVYLYENKEIIIHPQTITDINQTGAVKATYIRKPANPTWNFSSATGHYVWNPTTSVNFELDSTEQSNLIIQILLYAGVVIKDMTIIQAASAEIAKENQNERN